MAHTIRILVEIEVERVQGKFASRDEMVEELVHEIESADPGGIYNLGADGDTEYTITSWTAEEQA